MAQRCITTVALRHYNINGITQGCVMGYYDDKLPPKLYSKIERFIRFNWVGMLFVGILILWIILAVFYEDRSGYGDPYETMERYR